MVNPSVPASNLKEFIALAKARWHLTYGSAGVGSRTIVGELLQQDAGIVGVALDAAAAR